MKYLKDESNSVETIDRINLTNQTKFRLNESSKTENYSNQEIKERKLNSKKSSKYKAAFDCKDKILIAFSATSFFCNSYWSSCGNGKCKLYVDFSLTAGIIKELLNITKKIKGKNMIKYSFLLKAN